MRDIAWKFAQQKLIYWMRYYIVVYRSPRNIAHLRITNYWRLVIKKKTALLTRTNCRILWIVSMSIAVINNAFVHRTQFDTTEHDVFQFHIYRTQTPLRTICIRQIWNGFTLINPLGVLFVWMCYGLLSFIVSMKFTIMSNLLHIEDTPWFFFFDALLHFRLL